MAVLCTFFTEMSLPCQNSKTLLYFSYETNLLTKRFSLLNVNAEFLSIARLDNYRLDFIRYAKFWGGPRATIVPTANAHVWGVIWRVDVKDQTALDKQEGGELEKFYVKYIEVNTPHMGAFKCRAYIQKVNPLPRGDNDDIPVERWPSYSYKYVMVKGAIEHGLPTYYIEELKKMRDNGEIGCFRMACLLKTYKNNEPCKCTLPTYNPPKILNLRKMRQKKQHNKQIHLNISLK